MNTAGFLNTGAPRRMARTPSPPVVILGVQDKHLGPRMDYAQVSLRVEPAGCFEVVDRVDSNDPARGFDFPEAFTKGVLEVLDARGPRPPVRLVLERADHHAVDSSPHAFVEAGRDAGRKLLTLHDGG